MKGNSSLVTQGSHRGFLEHWNSQKSVCNIWQRFSCLLDEGIPKIWKKLNCHGCFLRADQGRAKMCCQMGWIGSAIWQVAQIAIVRIQFFIFLKSPLQVDMKIVVKCWKDFLSYFTTLKTYRVYRQITFFQKNLCFQFHNFGHLYSSRVLCRHLFQNSLVVDVWTIEH